MKLNNKNHQKKKLISNCFVTKIDNRRRIYIPSKFRRVLSPVKRKTLELVLFFGKTYIGSIYTGIGYWMYKEKAFLRIFPAKKFWERYCALKKREPNIDEREIFPYVFPITIKGCDRITLPRVYDALRGRKVVINRVANHLEVKLIERKE